MFDEEAKKVLSSLRPGQQLLNAVGSQEQQGQEYEHNQQAKEDKDNDKKRTLMMKKWPLASYTKNIKH